jgi:hypothetical protein
LDGGAQPFDEFIDTSDYFVDCIFFQVGTNYIDSFVGFFGTAN